MSFGKSRFDRGGAAKALAVASVLAALVLAPGLARAQDGVLGIYFDSSGRECSGNVPTASFATLHVVLRPEGSTYNGVTTAEFRIETPPGGSFLFQNPAPGPGANIYTGHALVEGGNVAFPSCQSSGAVEILTFQAISTGAPAQDVVLRVKARLQPTSPNPDFACPLVTLCDTDFTNVCIEGGVAVLNPSGQRPCGSSRVDSQWSRVKDLYRP